MIVDGIPVTLDASTMKSTVVEKPIIHTDHDEEDEDLLWFVHEQVALIKEDLAPFDFDCFSSLVVNYIVHKKWHFPGMTLGNNKLRAHPITNSKVVENLYGLGYKPTRRELRESIGITYRNTKDKDNIPFSPYWPTLNE